MSFDLQAILNLLAGTTGLAEQGAANYLAGTQSSPVAMLAALNIANGSVGLGFDQVCNELAGTTGLAGVAALNHLYLDAGSEGDIVTDLVEEHV